MRTKAIIYFVSLFITGMILGYLISQFVRGVLNANLSNLLAPFILATMIVILVNTLLQLFNNVATVPQIAPAANVELDDDIANQLMDMLADDEGDL